MRGAGAAVRLKRPRGVMAPDRAGLALGSQCVVSVW